MLLALLVLGFTLVYSRSRGTAPLPECVALAFSASVATVSLGLWSIWATAVLLLIAWALRTKEESERASTGFGSKPHGLEVFLLGLLALVGWLSQCGAWQLEPPPLFFWQLAREEAEFGLSGLALSLGGEAWRSALICGGALALLTLVLGRQFAARATNSDSARIVVTTFLALGSADALLTPGTPEEVFLRVWAVSILLTAVGPPRYRAFSLLPAAALVFSFPLAAGAIFCLLLPRDKWSNGPVLLGLAVCLFMKGLSLSSVLAAAVFWILKRTPNPAYWILISLEFWGPDWGLFGKVALALYLSEKLSPFLESRRIKTEPVEPGGVLVSKERLAVAALLGLFVAGALPGEKSFNSRVLVASQKAKFKLPHLFVPNSLSSWIALRGGAFGVSLDVVDMAGYLKTVEGPALFARPPVPSYRESAAASMLAEKPWPGWERIDGSEPSLEPGLAAYFLSRKSEFLSSPSVRRLVVAKESVLPVKEADSSTGAKGFPPVFPISLKIVSPADRCLDSNGLIPMEIALINPLAFPVALGEVERVWLECSSDSGLLAGPSLSVNWSELGSGEELRLTLPLRTPPVPARFQVALVFELSDTGTTIRQALSGEGFRSRSAVPRLDTEEESAQ